MKHSSDTLKRQLAILRRELQVAIEIELATIPPYLAALYSIPQDANRQSQTNIRAVVLEEMLHMTLAANVLNAVGGRPTLGTRGDAPGYPMDLPWHAPGLAVGLERFSPRQVETFCAIEAPKPESPLRERAHLLDVRRARRAARRCPPQPPPEPKGYRTIGEFYAALIGRLDWLDCNFDPKRVFTGDPTRQVRLEHYYGADGKVVIVRDCASAVEALRTIVLEGEGTTTSVWDGSHEAAVPPLPAHFYLFDEIRHERLYHDGDKPHQPRGAKFRVDWSAVYPMRPNPNRAEYEHKHPEIFRKLRAFDELFLGLLDQVDDAFNGQPDRLRQATARMYELRYAAVELLRIPDPLHAGQTVGPSFGSIRPAPPSHAGWWRAARGAGPATSARKRVRSSARGARAATGRASADR